MQPANMTLHCFQCSRSMEGTVWAGTLCAMDPCASTAARATWGRLLSSKESFS